MPFIIIGLIFAFLIIQRQKIADIIIENSPDMIKTSLFEQRIAPYQNIISAMAETYSVPEKIIKAVILTESSGDKDLISDNGNSAGLMMIWLPTANQYGYRGNIEGLTDPYTNINIGTRLLASLQKEYGSDIASIYAGYNDGSARKNAEGKFVNTKGLLIVQEHVDNFLKNYNSLIG